MPDALSTAGSVSIVSQRAVGGDKQSKAHLPKVLPVLYCMCQHAVPIWRPLSMPVRIRID